MFIEKIQLPETKIVQLDELYYKLISIENIVFTNGCFDVLHYGHFKCLTEAKTYGSTLIVAVNSDRIVKQLKGDHRPINIENIRLYNLSCLQCVDYVVMFDELTPYNIISKLKPDILVKGGDYNITDIVGHDLVSKTIIINFEDGFSTTSILNKLKT